MMRVEQNKMVAARKAFTLIELLVVIAIIAILLSIGIYVGIGARTSSQKKTTAATIKVLDTLMSDYLKGAPEPTDANWFGQLKAGPKASMLTTLGATTTGVPDAWGNPIHYIPNNSTPAGIAGWTPKVGGYFWSYGPDGVPGNDDIFSESGVVAP